MVNACIYPSGRSSAKVHREMHNRLTWHVYVTEQHPFPRTFPSAYGAQCALS